MDSTPWRDGLGDEFGPWCAWCVEYFPNGVFAGEHLKKHLALDDPPEKHHVLAKEHLPALLKGVMRAEETLIPMFPSRWIVYAHRRCHRYGRTTADLQDAATAATARAKAAPESPVSARGSE